MNRKMLYSVSGFVLLAFTCTTATPQADTPIEKKARQTAQKAANTVKRATKKVTLRAKGAAKKATNKAVSAVNNLPAPEWSKLSAPYEYEQGAPEVQEQPVERPNAVQLNITFTGPSGKPVEGVFLRPKAEKPYPCVLVLHGLTNNKEIALKMFSDRLLKNGMAILALDAPEHGKSQPKNKSYWNQQVIETAVREGVRNYRSALDWLTQREDIDPSKIGALGYSLGSITSVILGAVDERVSAFSLCVGGDPFLIIARTQTAVQKDSALYVSPSLYVSRLAGRPILFQNGKKDVVIVRPAAMLLHNAAKDPKQVAWYNGGHDLPTAIRTRASDWVAKKLAQSTPTSSGQ
jgi:uncharacterized protein